MGLLNSVWGSISGQITAASPEAFLYSLNIAGVCLRNVRYLDDLTVCVDMGRRDWKKACALADKSGAKVEIIGRKGVYWDARRLLSRPVLIIGIAIILFLTCFLPTRVLFVEIQGNYLLPASMILEKAAHCGVGFGASRRDVRSEATKNQLLSALPSLRWVGVNTRGCVAVISVQEKPVAHSNEGSGMIRHVVAAKDGIISDMTVLNGVSQCRVGQAVVKGQILISGYIDHGISLEGTSADAEIIGYTGNILRMITPSQRRIRKGADGVDKKYSFLIGKKLINFSKDSGISVAECVRMYKEKYLTLPGGFCLPVALVEEQTISFSLATENTEDAGSFAWVESAAEQYLRSQMLSGEILRSNVMTELCDGKHVLYGTYQCREIIGRIHSEEKWIADEQRS